MNEETFLGVDWYKALGEKNLVVVLKLILLDIWLCLTCHVMCLTISNVLFKGIYVLM